MLVPGVLERELDAGKDIPLVAMTGYHGALARWRRFFSRDANSLTPKFYRFINEVPTILMIFIVILTTTKPNMMSYF